VAIILAWIAAWYLKIYLDRSVAWTATSGGSFGYWTAAKLVLWILPALRLVRLSGRSLVEVCRLSNWRAGLYWGGGLGLLLGLMGVVSNYWQGEPILPTQFSWQLVSVLMVAPTLEEFLMRGAVLGNLQTRYSFATANIISSVMFVILHIPGWLFMGTPLTGAVPIFLVSLVFGYATHRSHSIVGGIIAHFLNNLF